eukprot:810046-Rhodomonas_salina.1
MHVIPPPSSFVEFRTCSFPGLRVSHRATHRADCERSVRRFFAVRRRMQVVSGVWGGQSES